MWHTNTYWFDVATATTLLMLGHLYLGRFSEYQPRSLRLLKSILGIALIVATSALFGREWSWVLIGAIALGVIAIHGWWLPRHGVNGWTAEPRDRYYELLGLDSQGRQRQRARR